MPRTIDRGDASELLSSLLTLVPSGTLEIACNRGRCLDKGYHSTGCSDVSLHDRWKPVVHSQCQVMSSHLSGHRRSLVLPTVVSVLLINTALQCFKASNFTHWSLSSETLAPVSASCTARASSDGTHKVVVNALCLTAAKVLPCLASAQL